MNSGTIFVADVMHVDMSNDPVRDQIL